MKVGLSFALFSLLCDFVLLRIAGKIKDLFELSNTFVIFSVSPNILAFSNF